MSFFDKLKTFVSGFLTMGKNAYEGIKSGFGKINEYSNTANKFLNSRAVKGVANGINHFFPDSRIGDYYNTSKKYVNQIKNYSNLSKENMKQLQDFAGNLPSRGQNVARDRYTDSISNFSNQVEKAKTKVKRSIERKSLASSSDDGFLTSYNF